MTLKTRFFDAFASRPRPSGDEILRPSVRHDGDRLRELLATRTSTQLSPYELRSEVEGNLWMLSPKAFRYFLPAFLSAALECYDTISVFASELVTALTKPDRADVEAALDRLSGASPRLRLPEETTRQLREQQLDWFDSGTPSAIFHERVEDLSQDEGRAILAFFDAFRERHGADFPFGELDAAIDRYWNEYGPF
ncbi:MAG: hypothetical protein EA405_06300 [Rhodospirillales bacterium]|nr:MAG: hypothetical protein EA405_06300 [Rhodospirillales bacterium]